MRYVFFLLTTFFIITTPVNADIIMGIVPQQSPLKLMKVWSPIAKYLSEKTGEKIIFKTEKSIKKFEDVLYSGGYDFAYMSPIHYLVSHKKLNYTAHIRAKKNIIGILVMKNGDSIEKLRDKNTRFLFPSDDAFAATLLTKYDLINTYGADIETLNKARYVNSHDSVYKGVQRGIGDVGGGIERTFTNLNDQETKKSLNIVHKTAEYPSHPFAFSPNMSKNLQDSIVKALLKMPKGLLNSLSINQLIEIDDEEYAGVKTLATKLQIMPE